jgi:PKD repeat protein
MNLTWNITIGNGTAPYFISLHWGDTSIQHIETSVKVIQVFHLYYTAGQANYCYNVVCGNISVWVTDSATPTAGNATITAQLVPGISPQAAHTFYDLLPIYKMGYTGTGTKIGIDDMCDTSYPQADYMTDVNSFSAKMGLPEMTASTLVLMGSGGTTCTGGSSGWSGETLLDIEWAHTMAPGATLEVDLADSALDEGDHTWNTLSNGVYIASNSWTWSGYHANYWTTAGAASHGESYLSASGDCGELDLAGGSDHPADNPYGIGVGGTQVYPYPSGVFRAEYAWNGTDDPNCVTQGNNDAGSGGGYSTAFAAPGYQVGMQGFNDANRGVPDISAIGGTWVMMVYEGAITLSAGTSLACPSSAAMLDLMYQYNGSAAGTKGNGMADYDFYAIAKTSNYHIGFHDIVVGNNKVGAAGYTTTPGWDPVTGLGSFNVSQLAQLVAAQNANPSPYSAITAVIVSNVTYGPESLAVNFGADAAGGTTPLTGYSYAWTFGDGSTANTAQYYTNHVYTCGGTFGAYVTVSEGTATPGVSNTLNIKVTGTPCSSLLTPGTLTLNSTGPGETSFVEGTVATFSGGTSTFTPTWCWGDGTKTTGIPITASPAYATHTYSTAGTFTPRVFINDSAANTVNMAPTPLTLYTHVAVSAITPSAWGPWTPPANRTFSATPSAGSGGYTYAWNFNDGNTSTVASPPYQIYYKPGTYTVTLTVTDSLSYQAATSLTFQVYGTASTITLAKGQNFIALPTVANSYTLYEISVLAGVAFAGENLLSGSTSTLYDRGADKANGNVAFAGGNALWLNVSAAETITVYGNTTASLSEVPYMAGWAAIGWSVSTGTTASALASLIGGVTEVAIWSTASGQWATFIVGWDTAGGAHDFTIATGAAVLVYTSGAGAFAE